MDVRELPRMLFQEFALATLEATEDRWMGETAEGAGLVLRLRNGSYGNAILELHWHCGHPNDKHRPTLIIEIEAGLRESDDFSGTAERLDEGAWIRQWGSPNEWARDLSLPRVALVGRFITRASELIRSRGFELTSVLYDRKRGKRLEPPLPKA